MEARKRAFLAVLLFLITSACAHDDSGICRQIWGYSISEDGTIIVQGVIAYPSGMIAHPYDGIIPSDPAYEEKLNRIVNDIPDFRNSRSGTLTREVPCRG
jgi:hypothetical protein